MDQMSLFEKMDTLRLEQKPKRKDNFHAHECKDCGFLLKLPWKVKGFINKEGRGSICNTVHVGRHLEKHCDKTGRNSIREKLLENAEKIKNEE